MQGSDCSSMEMKHREGQRRVGIEGKLCFWKQHFHGLWQDMLRTSSDGARVWDKWWKMGHREKLAFLFTSEQSESYERISVLPQVTSQIHLTIKFGVRRGKVPVKQYFPSLVQCWTKPVPYFFHVQSFKKMLFCFPPGMQMLSWLFLFM